jgi:hypothetical protein
MSSGRRWIVAIWLLGLCSGQALAEERHTHWRIPVGVGYLAVGAAAGWGIWWRASGEDSWRSIDALQVAIPVGILSGTAGYVYGQRHIDRMLREGRTPSAVARWQARTCSVIIGASASAGLAGALWTYRSTPASRQRSERYWRGEAVGGITDSEIVAIVVGGAALGASVQLLLDHQLFPIRDTQHAVRGPEVQSERLHWLVGPHAVGLLVEL